MTTAAEKFEHGLTDRNIYLERGRTAASLTVPYLLPDSNDPGAKQNDQHTLPWSGMGARGVMNLASRLLLALLPPTELFFRLTLNEAQVQKAGGLTPEKRLEIEQGLVVLEQQILRGIEASGDRVVIHEMLLHLLVPGNVLLYMGDNGSRLFHMHRYVCYRDPMGNPIDAVTCEEIAYSEASEKVRKIVDSVEPEAKDRDDPERTVRIYTWIKWRGNRVTWHQEVRDTVIPGSKGRSTKENCPWRPLRMSRVDGQSYSPGFVETAVLADLNTAEALSQSVVECASILAIVRFLCKPGGVTNAKTLADAANGDFVPGDINDVKALQTEKAMELQAAMAALDRVESRLAQSFLLANPRDSERTTAEEIRLMALELEQGLGSIYSILADEFQRPYVKRRLYLETKKGGLPELDGELVQPVLATGLNALGRGSDVEKLMRFTQAIGTAMPNGEGMQVVKVNELVKRIANGLGITTLGLLKTEKELAQERQQAMQMQAATTLAASPLADPQKNAQAAAIEQQMAEGGGAPPEPSTTEVPA